MKTNTLLLCILTLLCTLHAAAAGNHWQQQPPTMRIINEAVQDEMAKQQVTGCAVAVIRGGIIVHAAGYGHTSPARTTPITVNSVFRWASVSKPLTATAVFKVIENSRLNLSDKVSDKVPYWPRDGGKGDITVQHLLNHRSGINYYTSFNRLAYWASGDFDAQQCVNVFNGSALLFVPGTSKQYTTFGYNLLGAVVEQASGIPYEKFIRDSIAAAVGMPSLSFTAADPGGWVKDCNGFLTAATEGSVEWKLPGGGWSSNILDMGAFVNGLLRQRFLRNTNALWTNMPGNGSHAFGLLRGDVGDEVYAFHNGVHADVRTYIGLYPAGNLGVAVMANAGNEIDINRLARRIEEAMGKSREESAKIPVNYCGDNSDCGYKAAGIWRQTSEPVTTIIRRGYTQDEFLAEWKWLRDIGYECFDFETYTDGFTRKWDGLFKKTNVRGQIWRNADSDVFWNKWRAFSDDGYRLIDIEVYYDGPTKKWAGLFTWGGGKHAMNRNMTPAELHQQWEEKGSRGLQLIDIEYHDGQWAGVWREGPRNSYFTGRTADEFRQKREELRNNGRRLIDVETYMEGGQQKWAGIWERASADEKFAYGYQFCNWLMNHHQLRQAAGYELLDLEVW